MPSPEIPLSFAPGAVRALPIKGASAVTPSRAGLLVVEDDLGIFRLTGSTATLWAGPDLHPALADLEGIAANDRGDLVWALSEEHGTVVEIRIRAGRPRVIRSVTLERPGRAKNKGFEGIAWLAPRWSPSGRAALVAVHEHKPRRVSVCDLASLSVVADLKLPGDAKDLLDDLADVAVDPVSGLLVLLSQESRRLAVMRLAADGLRLIQSYDLPLERRERPEGLAFLTATRLAIVTDGPARLLTLRVTRPSGPRV